METLWQFISSGDILIALYHFFSTLFFSLLKSLVEGFGPIVNDLEELIARKPILIIGMFAMLILFSLYQWIQYLLERRMKKVTTT